jgi:adenylate kinase
VTVVAVLGLSGVGKSRLVRLAAAKRDLFHLSASDLIKARLAHTSEELRKGAVLDNQALMLSEFADRVAAAGDTPVVFDGHSIIDTPAGLLDIPLAVFQAIDPAAIVYITADPKVIEQRRCGDSGRVRPQRSADDLANHQALALARARYFAAELGIPFHVLTSDGVDAFTALLG